jgi:hypothetical protein
MLLAIPPLYLLFALNLPCRLAALRMPSQVWFIPICSFLLRLLALNLHRRLVAVAAVLLGMLISICFFHSYLLCRPCDYKSSLSQAALRLAQMLPAPTSTPYLTTAFEQDPTYASYLDIQKAFDTLNRDLMMLKLRDSGALKIMQRESCACMSQLIWVTVRHEHHAYRQQSSREIMDC